ncbi:hypothetical protein [Sphingobium baderi]|uniref:Uncharacterized protein n=1 Tax=Sphingobium baderi LL03 TaxID=1114964 RepID=T0HBY4_9SPHN|nr:hypothetical protein [Sphingobium baderi]EQA96864.1 hypothetical protein L485_22550 [Sphingobium baderi LL03]KMS64127.1 hypothetical protein V475_20250 [Sphingobium baderi LL03]
MMLTILSALLLLASANAFLHQRRITKLESEIAQLSANDASLFSALASTSTIISTVASKPTLKLDANGLICGIEVQGAKGPTVLAPVIAELKGS